jgi:hypothetical protein
MVLTLPWDTLQDVTGLLQKTIAIAILSLGVLFIPLMLGLYRTLFQERIAFHFVSSFYYTYFTPRI